ncbi:AzlD domain-containing protein [Pigmentiphaga aceris]|uniref:AzlD domain-containing protein n=1 Tax=Pigmentiphaga aceris TaxID=1940612 RepID=A0A5C0AZS0_9BURK|nr:AzlD domain-containing protein [Pigmentiphaga aceris]QEI07959.1 AzlD domain-containing protein [Pigmentiphaga aceris]
MSAQLDFWYAVLVIAAMALNTFITRCGYLLFGDHIPLSPSVRRALKYAPVAALAAIVVPEMAPWTVDGPQLDLRLLAGLSAIPVFLISRSITLTMVVGMMVLWGTRWLVG